MHCWIQIHETVYPVDTDDEIAEAKAALREAEIQSCPVYVGDPDTIDSYTNGQRLFA